MKKDVDLFARMNETEWRLWDETFLTSARNNIRDSSYNTATTAAQLADHAIMLRRGTALRLKIES
jgi:hypothetical protein